MLEKDDAKMSALLFYFALNDMKEKQEKFNHIWLKNMSVKVVLFTSNEDIFIKIVL